MCAAGGAGECRPSIRHTSAHPGLRGVLYRDSMGAVLPHMAALMRFTCNPDGAILQTQRENVLFPV